MEHTAMELYFHSTKDKVRGRRNNNNPVILFITVCRDINCFFETYPHGILLILMAAITPTQIHNHLGIWIAGNNRNKDAATKRKSAMVSSWLPNWVAVFVFLAMVPSIISLKPHRIYVI